MDNTGRLCSVCHAATTQNCGGCSEVYYCSIAHQKQHWNTHKLHCKPYKICSNPQLGRHLIASRNLKAGDVIFREKAAVTGPEHGAHPVCLSCYDDINEDNACHCPGCNFPFCSKKCTKSPVHVEECKVLSRAKVHFTIADYGKPHPAYDCILPLRCLLLKESRPKDHENFCNLESHTEKHRGSDLWREFQDKVVNFLRQSCRMEQRFTEEEIHEAWCAVDINAFMWKPPSRGPICGIFPAAGALLAHNCIANVTQSIHDHFWMITRATVPVKRGEILFMRYTGPIQGTKDRRAFLRERKYFECNCARCSDPTECQTYLSALKCQQCSEGNVLPLKPLDPDSDWKCDHCSYRLTSGDVDKIIGKLQKEYDAIGKNDVEMVESFLQSHTSLLHPNHYFFGTAQRWLNALYGFDPRYLLQTLSPALLKRKIDIGQQQLRIADVLAPGLSLTRGNILIDMHVPIMLLASNRSGNKHISKEEFKERILQSCEIAEESYRILSLEPADSDEGKVAKNLQTSIRQMQQMLSKFNSIEN